MFYLRGPNISTNCFWPALHTIFLHLQQLSQFLFFFFENVDSKSTKKNLIFLSSFIRCKFKCWITLFSVIAVARQWIDASLSGMPVYFSLCNEIFLDFQVFHYRINSTIEEICWMSMLHSELVYRLVQCFCWLYFSEMSKYKK